MAVPLNDPNDICNCNDKYKGLLLQLFDDKCFKITDGNEVFDGMCMNDWGFPLTTYTNIRKRIDSCNNTSIIIFDNNFNVPVTSTDVLQDNCEYARGVILRIEYPLVDDNGDEIKVKDRYAKIRIQGADGVITEYPLYDFFAMTFNPQTDNPSQLINKIEILNPNANYKFQVEGIIVFSRNDI